ncbi:hypothetical protein SUDANB58_05183 [Streptomyces sp. enrichment culture]
MPYTASGADAGGRTTTLAGPVPGGCPGGVERTTAPRIAGRAGGDDAPRVHRLPGGAPDGGAPDGGAPDDG